jgi:nucleotidyltransferase/DNA polymerase involved in DNA repair
MSAGRVILHLDMDAFYAAIEVHDDPALQGKPLIVGHRGRRGVVTTCSYEARRFGVRSAMPSLTAERLCPQATWMPVRMDRYVEVSRRLRQIFDATTPRVEPLSIDEAFLDLTGVAAVRTLEDGRRIAADLKAQIVRTEGLTASVGVAPNKFLAKIASDLEKPDGLVVFPLEEVPSRLWPLAARRLWGVGPKTEKVLDRAGLHTIGDVAKSPVATLETIVGENWGAQLHALAHGLDDRPVEPDRAARSISEERTYAEDLHDPDAIDRELLARAEGVARALRAEGLRGRTVHLKVRTGDFKTITRAHTLEQPTDLAEPIVAAARALLRERVELKGRGIRLLGVGMSGLGPASSEGLFTDPGEERVRRATRAADALRKRLGEAAITRARLLDRKKD